MPDFEDRATAVRAGEELNVEALDAYLRAHFPDERGPLDVKQFPKRPFQPYVLRVFGQSRVRLAAASLRQQG